MYLTRITPPPPQHGPTFWILLFGFLNNIVTAILTAVTSFLSFFYDCLSRYVAFELDMTKAFISMDHWQLFMVLTTVILLVNGALFWAWMMMKAVLPWRLEGARREEWLWKIDKVM